MAYGTNVPKPSGQGGHASAPTQGTSTQAKKGAADPSPSTVLYSKQPGGFGGSKKTS